MNLAVDKCQLGFRRLVFYVTWVFDARKYVKIANLAKYFAAPRGDEIKNRAIINFFFGLREHSVDGCFCRYEELSG